jgi:hypothetical protein
LSPEIFEALGFTTIEPHGVSPFANPVGLDGVFGAYCPPYFPSMDAAVDTVLTPMLRTGSALAEPTKQQGPVPYLISDTEHRDGAVRSAKKASHAPRRSAITSIKTYGRFPGNVDAMHLIWFMQAHHLDTDYYGRFFRPGAYGATHAAHMGRWHP